MSKTRTPRYFQREAKDATVWGWEKHDRQVVHLGTGAGKTFVSTMIIDEMAPDNCLFIADQQELCEQPLRELMKAGIIAGLEKAGSQAPLSARVVVASSQTMQKKKRRERFPRNHFKRIVVDECHRRTEADIETCDYFEEAKVAGLTATPFKMRLANLSKWYGAVAYTKSMVDLVREAWAPIPKLLTLPVEISLANIRKAITSDGRDFNAEDVGTSIEPFFDIIADFIKSEANDRYGIAYLPLIASSKAFTQILQRHGITARHVDGNSPDRAEIIEAFGRREFHWLVNAGVVSTGVDIPLADAFLNLRVTMSRAWYQQARGRVLRPAPGVIDHLPEKDQIEMRRELIRNSIKPDALIIDLLWQDGDMTVVRGGDDFCDNEHDAEELFKKSKENKGPIDILAMQKFVQEQREGNLIAALERAALRTSMQTPLTAEQTAAILDEPEIVNYVEIQAWELQPPSENQLNNLRGRMIDVSSIKTMGYANKLISVLHWRSQCGMATLKQCKLIKQLNQLRPDGMKIENVSGLTISEATTIIDAELAARRAGG